MKQNTKTSKEILIKLPKFIAISWFFFFFIGCQTIPKNPFRTDSLPLPFKKRFTTCYPSDGSLEIAYFSENLPVFSELTLDYIGTNSNPFIGEISTPLGKTILKMEYDQSKNLLLWNYKPEYRDTKIQLDEKGYLTWNGQFTGLKLNELMCIFKNSWPSSWLTKGTHFIKKPKYYKLFVHYEDREIQLTYNTKSILIECAKITWSYALGMFPQKIKICQYPKAQKGTLNYDSKNLLTWVKDAE